MSDLFSLACTSIRHVIMEALQCDGQLKGIYAGEHEVLVNEGKLVLGFLVTRRGSDLLAALLARTVDEFEQRYGDLLVGVLKPTMFHTFNEVVTRYFEFALPVPMDAIIL